MSVNTGSAPDANSLPIPRQNSEEAFDYAACIGCGACVASSYHVTETELAILDALWRSGPTTIRRLSDELYPDGGTSGYATVQKLLERLESKDLVVRDRSALAHVFRTAIDREDLVGHELHEVASKLCEGSLTPLLLNLVKEARLTREDRDVLRQLLDEGETQS